jgi:hypothetical protein
MKQAITAFAISLGFVAAPALAEPTNSAQPQAVKMSDAQLDNVVGGQLIVAVVPVTVAGISVPVDVRALNNSVNDNNVQVPIAATVSAAVAVLGNAAALAQQFGASAAR